MLFCKSPVYVDIAYELFTVVEASKVFFLFFGTLSGYYISRDTMLDVLNAR